MIFGYLLLVLIPVAAIAYLIWNHKRRMAERNVASAGRLHEILGTVAQPELTRAGDRPAAPAAPPADAPPPSAMPEASATPAAAATAPALYAVRKRVLSPPQTLLYYLLKTGLPDHLILPRVTLAALLDTGPALNGFAREEQVRRLASLTVDFAVVDKNMQPVVVIELAAPDSGGAAQADRDATRSRLDAAGVKYIELDPAALPRKDALRALVLDTPAAADAPRTASAGLAG